MENETEFKHIYESANYARVEDAIQDLGDELAKGTDPNEVGYGIARNTSISGNSRDIERIEDTVGRVKRDLSDIEGGIKSYEKTFQRVYGNTPQTRQPVRTTTQTYGDSQSRSGQLTRYTSKVVSGRYN